MINRIIKIFDLYRQNKGFSMLTAIVLFTGIASKISYHMRLYALADDLFTLLFIFTLWLAFLFGILIKHQFASCRAHVLPGYRTASILTLMIFYLVFIGLSILWGSGMKLDFPWMPHVSMAGVWSTALIVSLFVILLGYYSIGRFLLYGYCFLVLSSIFFVQIMDIYRVNHAITFLPLILWFTGIIFFIWRLFSLREESFEYAYLLTWPPKESAGYLKRKRLRVDAPSRLEVTGKKYPKKMNIMKRAAHWDLSEGKDVNFIWSVILVLAGIYVLVFFNVTWVINWLKNVNNNFFLLVFTPLVIVTIRHYKNLIFWGLDILRPLQKKEYFKDQIARVFLHVFQYWLLIGTVLGFIPTILFVTDGSVPILGYFFLSGSILFLIISVLIYITANDENVTVIVNGAMLSYIVLLFFEPASFLNAKGYILTCLVCLAGGLIYIRRGYHAWCLKEYV
jgi:hypothetical protein